MSSLLMLTMLVFGAILVFTTFSARYMIEDIGGILILAILLIGQVLLAYESVTVI